MLENVRYSALASTWSPHYDRFLLRDDRHKPSAVECIELAGQVQALDGVELIHPAHVNVENVKDIRSALDANNLALSSLAASISSPF